MGANVKITSELLSKISKEYGESFYILNTKQFKKNFIELKNAFQSIYPKSNIAYSYKTNYIPRLCKIIDDFGGYAEVVSDMESEIALRLGVKPEHIVFNGPYKNPKVTKELVLKGVNINVDSLDDMNTLIELASENPENEIAAGIRCNFDIGDGVLSRFGFCIESDDFKKALDTFATTTNLRLKGFHSHFASRDFETWSNRTEGILAVVDKYSNVVPEYICLGGGLFGKMNESLKKQFTSYIPTYAEYANVSASLFQKKYGYLSLEKQPELLIEPGSALVGDVMMFAAKVKSIKKVREQPIATVLGSIYNINPTLNNKNLPLEIIKMNEETNKYENLSFGGFTCIESDYLYKGYNEKLAIGDYAVFSNVGSYSIVLKPPFILPNFTILEYDEDIDKLSVVKRAECFDDLFHTYKFY